MNGSSYSRCLASAAAAASIPHAAATCSTLIPKNPETRHPLCAEAAASASTNSPYGEPNTTASSPGTQTAPPFSTMKGSPIPIRVRHTSISARVLLEQRINGIPRARSRAIPGSAAANEYVSWSSKVPSKSLITKRINRHFPAKQSPSPESRGYNENAGEAPRTPIAKPSAPFLCAPFLRPSAVKSWLRLQRKRRQTPQTPIATSSAPFLCAPFLSVSAPLR